MRSGRFGSRATIWKAWAVFVGFLCSGDVSPVFAAETPAEAKPRDGARTPVKAALELIDQRIKESWELASIKPSPGASDEEFLRRAYLDIIGRIPNIQEARGFLQAKESGKRKKLVEYLLNHPDYAKNFANQWTVLLIGRKTRDRDLDRGGADRLASQAVQWRTAVE